MPAPTPPRVLTRAEWNLVKPPTNPRHYFIGVNDAQPPRPNLRDWTAPTYYQKAYDALFSGFSDTLTTPLIIEERHYDPYSHLLIFEGKRYLYRPSKIYRPPGTYISVKADADAQAVDADKDFDGDGI